MGDESKHMKQIVKDLTNHLQLQVWLEFHQSSGLLIQTLP